MPKAFFAIGAAFLVATSPACGKPSDDMPVTPTVGTIATVQGTVVASGSYLPLAGVLVTIDGVMLTTRLDGTYAVSGLKPGNTTLTAERPGFQKFSESVFLEGAKTFNIFLAPSDFRGLP
jgi:hypothetical protein